jgi:hypothetical protein
MNTATGDSKLVLLHHMASAVLHMVHDIFCFEHVRPRRRNNSDKIEDMKRLAEYKQGLVSLNSIEEREQGVAILYLS